MSKTRNKMTYFRKLTIHIRNKKRRILHKNAEVHFNVCSVNAKKTRAFQTLHHIYRMGQK